MSDNSPTSPVTRWVRRRLDLLWSGGRVGLAAGGFLVLLALVVVGDRVRATTAVFALGSLVLGLSLLGWGLATLVGGFRDGVGAGWTEADLRRAATRGAGAGAAAMVGATVVSILVSLA